MDEDPRQYGCCRRCRREWEEDDVNAHLGVAYLLTRTMHVCPECGWKRCLKADDHTNDCTADQRA